MRAMVRSGMAAMVSGVAASGAIFAMVAMLVSHHWVATGVFAAAAVVLYVVAYALIRRADPALLKQRARENEKRGAVLGRALSRASGGWDIDSRPRREERRRPRR